MPLTTRQRSSRSGVRSRRAARAQQVRRDLLRYQTALEDWVRSIDPARSPDLRPVRETVVDALSQMRGTPRPVTGWTVDDSLTVLEVIDRRDDSGRTSRVTSAHLHLWATFLVETGRWSQTEKEAARVCSFLAACLQEPPGPPLDVHEVARLRRVAMSPSHQTDEVAALRQTPPVRQCARWLDWLAAGGVATASLAPDADTVDAVMAVLSDVEGPAVDHLRVLHLWFALRIARLVTVRDGRVVLTPVADDWSREDPNRMCEVLRSVADTLWSSALRFGSEERGEAVVVLRGLLAMVEGRRVSDATVTRLMLEQSRDLDDWSKDSIHARFDALAADGALLVDDHGWVVPEPLRAAMAASVEDCLEQWPADLYG